MVKYGYLCCYLEVIQSLWVLLSLKSDLIFSILEIDLLKSYKIGNITIIAPKIYYRYWLATNSYLISGY